MSAEAIEVALEAVFFGSMWYLGIMVFMMLSISIMKLWKYAGALIIPLIVALEVEYYNRLDIYGNFIWAMLILLLLAFGIALYTVTSYNKKGGD